MALNTHSVPGAVISMLLFLALTLPAPAIPLEIRDSISHAIPAGFEAIPATNLHPEALASQVFKLQGSDDTTPPTWLSIRRVSTSGTNVMRDARIDPSDDFKVVGRFSERLYNLDIAILESELQTNDITLRRRSAQLPSGTDVFLLDLQSPSLKTNEMDAIMRHVVKAIAEQNSATPRSEVQGWKSAVVCLLMVAMVFVVAIARR